MKYKCYFDRFKLKCFEDKKFIVIHGWSFSTDGSEYELATYVNHQEVDSEKTVIVRQDVVKKFPKKHIDKKCGFKFVIPCEQFENVDLFQLYAVTPNGKTCIKSINKDEILENTVKTSIESHLDAYFKNVADTNKFSISGWAVSLDHDKLKYALYDSHQNEVKHTIRFTNRTDLYRLKLIEEDQKYCGFTIEFEGNKSEKYTLVISNAHDKVSIDVQKAYISKNKQNLFKLRHYLSLLTIRNCVRGAKYLIKHGPKGLIERLKKGSFSFGIPYGDWFEAHKVTQEELARQKEVKFEYQPLISVIVPTYNTPEEFLREMIDSVVNQSYPNWELCIADGSNGNTTVEKVLNEYVSKDKRIKFVLLEDNYGISGNTNKALELATGEYVGLFDHDDLLTPDCLFEIVQSLQEQPYDIIYTDEDKVDSEGIEFSDPNFKPDFSIDLLRSHNYITHFFVVKTDIIKGVGGFRSEFDGAQDYDVMFRCIEKAKSIHHTAKILYHWRMHAGSTAENPESKMYCYEAGRKAVEEHYQRVGIKAKVEKMDLWGMYHTIYETEGNPLVSIVIPNKDQKAILKTCIDSLFNINTYPNFEIIIIENNSETREIFDYYEELQKEHNNVKVVTYKGEFNYSSINNYGVTFTSGDYLLFLNNDTQMINPNALSEMLGCCMRDEVGIVGAKLLYEDDTVQHGGVVIGFGGFAGHVFTGIDRDEYGYMVRAQINCNYSAVTAACMMVKKSVFNEVNGFTEEFKVGLNDIDFCLKVRQLNKLVVFNAFALWYHFESKSRGYEDTVEKQQRFEREIHLFQERWKQILLDGDPYYNKNFIIELGPFKLG